MNTTPRELTCLETSAVDLQDPLPAAVDSQNRRTKHKKNRSSSNRRNNSQDPRQALASRDSSKSASRTFAEVTRTSSKPKVKEAELLSRKGSRFERRILTRLSPSDQRKSTSKISSVAGKAVDNSRIDSRPVNKKGPSSTPCAPQPSTSKSSVPAGTVVIRSSSNSRTGVQLRKQISEAFNPSKIGISVKSVLTGKDSVVIRVQDKPQADILLDKLQSAQLADVSFKKTQGKSKTFVVLGVPTCHIKEEIISCICSSTGCEATNITWKTTLKGKQPEISQHWVFEAPVPLVQKLVRGKRILLRFDPCLVKPFFSVLRCFRSQRFGHSQRGCQQPPRCVNCGGPHDHLPCNNTGWCVNCARANQLLDKKWPTNHSARDSNCPCYLETVGLRKRGMHWMSPSDLEDVALPRVVLTDEDLEQALEANLPDSPTSPIPPPHLKKMRNRTRSPVNNRSLSPPLLASTVQENLMPRYLTRARSQERLHSEERSMEGPPPSTIPETPMLEDC